MIFSRLLFGLRRNENMHDVMRKLHNAGFLVSIISSASGSIIVYLQSRSITSLEVINVIGEGHTVFHGGHGSVVVMCK
jgi:hypothetical protein